VASAQQDGSTSLTWGLVSRQQSTYSKRTRSSPTTTSKGCGLRHFWMFFWPNQNDDDAGSPAPAWAVVYESLGQECREDLLGLSHGLSTNIATVAPWVAAWRTVRRCFGR
jgi:hypothetical protein